MPECLKKYSCQLLSQRAPNGPSSFANSKLAEAEHEDVLFFSRKNTISYRCYCEHQKICKIAALGNNKVLSFDLGIGNSVNYLFWGLVACRFHPWVYMRCLFHIKRSAIQVYMQKTPPIVQWILLSLVKGRKYQKTNTTSKITYSDN